MLKKFSFQNEGENLEKETLADGVLKDVVQFVVETAEENPVIVAKITPNFIEVANGYRVRLKPDYNSQCSLSKGGQGSLP